MKFLIMLFLISCSSSPEKTPPEAEFEEEDLAALLEFSDTKDIKYKKKVKR